MIDGQLAALLAENDAMRRKLLALEAVFSAFPDLHFRLASDGTVLDYRAGQTSSLYIPPETFMGKRMQDVLPPEVGELILRTAQAALSSEKGQRIEYSLPMAGQEQWFEAHMIPLEDGEIATFVRNISEHRRDKEELSRLNDELQRQVLERTTAMRALSTPLVPIARNVVAVPLIGAIDAERAAQLLETLLQGVLERAASVVLLDVTGVPSLDASAADAIVRTAKAVGLLGAKLVLTGIGPGVAQTLVELGADLRGIVTLNSLEQGIAFAMSQAQKAQGKR